MVWLIPLESGFKQRARLCSRHAVTSVRRRGLGRRRADARPPPPSPSESRPLCTPPTADRGQRS